MSKRDTPKWIYKHLQTCKRALGMEAPTFELHVQLCDAPVADAEQVRGHTETETQYGRAVIRLARDLTPDALGYEILTHEAFHAAMGAQQTAVARIIDLVPEALHDHALALWHDGNEATITQLARALTPLLRGMKRE